MFMVYLISHASPFVSQLLITPACTPCLMELWKARCPFKCSNQQSVQVSSILQPSLGPFSMCQEQAMMRRPGDAA